MRPLLFSLVLLTLTGCTPSITPLYRDFEPQERSLVAARDSIRLDVQEALTASGWALAAPSVEGFITTEERILGERLLYQVVASLDVAFVGDRAIRVYVQPYRRYVTGGRSKLGFLSGSVEREILSELRDALKDKGIVALGTARERDEEAREEQSDRAEGGGTARRLGRG